MPDVTRKTPAQRWAAAATTSVRDPIRAAVSIIGGLVLLALPVWVLLHLNHGLDVSDTGYYHASISYLSDNRMAVTQFGVIWNLLPLPDDILVRRLALFALVTLSSAWMAVEAFHLLNIRSNRLRLSPDQFLFGGVGVGAGVFYASLWLIDPSYNSMALGLSCALIAVAFRIARLRLDAPVSSFAAGLLVVLLLYVRQPTAGALGILLAIFVLALTRPGLGRLGKLAGVSLGGMVGAVVLVWLLVEPPGETWDRFQGGLELASVLARDVDHVRQFERFLTSVADVVFEYWYVLVWSVLTAASGVFTRLRAAGIQILLPASLSVLLLGTVGLKFAALPDQARAFYAFHGEIAALAGLVGLAVALGKVLASFKSRSRRLETRRLVVVVLLLLSGIAVVFWTASGWFPRLAWVGVMPVLALLVASHSVNRWQFVAASGAVVGVLMMLQFAFLSVVSQTPYRLAEPLQSQTFITEVRHGRSTLLTDEVTHQLLNAFSEASADLAGCEDDARPVLLDMTGRMPMAAYHINARPPGRSWVLSGYPGSAELFEFVIDQLDDATLQSAWILDAPDYHQRHDLDVLLARGVDFERDHDLVAEVYAPYPDAQLRLYRPKGGVACARP